MDTDKHPQDKNVAEKPILPKISELVQRLPAENKEADVGEFIEEIRKSSDLPEDIFSALNEARSRIKMDIPDPPADLWDSELEELSRLPGQQDPLAMALPSDKLKRQIVNAADPIQADAGTYSVFDDDSTIGELSDKKAKIEDLDLFKELPPHALLADSAADGTSDKAQIYVPQATDAAAVADTTQTACESDTLTTAESEIASATEPESATAETDKDVEKKDDSETTEEVASDVQAPPAIDEAALAETAKKKKWRLNPWSLFFGKNNLVDATATLIFMHAVLLLGLELAWKQMPQQFFGINKTGFAGFVLATTGIQVLTLLFPMFLSFNTYRLPSGTVMGKTKIDRPMILASLLLGVPAALFFNGINNLFTYLMISWDLPLPTNILPTWSRPEGFVNLLITLLIAALVPAMLEELFFRGFLMKSLYGLGGKKLAIVLSALAFALYHNDPLFLIGPFGVGILLGYLRKNTESVLPTILTHLSINLATFLLDPVLPRFNAQMILLFPADGQSNLMANIVATASSGIVLFFIYRFINFNLVHSRAYTGFTTGRRAAIYGRNRQHKEAVLASPDRHYKVPPLTLVNYIRFFAAIAVWIFSRFLA